MTELKTFSKILKTQTLTHSSKKLGLTIDFQKYSLTENKNFGQIASLNKLFELFDKGRLEISHDIFSKYFEEDYSCLISKEDYSINE
jgi:hypothetical protein